MELKRFIAFAQRDPVRAVGFSCLAVGAIMVLASAASLASRAVIKAQLGKNAFTTDGPFGQPTFEVRHYKLIAGVLTGVGIILGATGVFALRRHTRARPIIEILVWGALVMMLIGGPVRIWIWVHERPSVQWFIVPAGTLVILFSMAVFYVVIRFLRNEAVRDEFAQR